MCGFAGYIQLDDGAISEPVLWRMAERLEHRGPDEGAVLALGPCGLAHRRLSIIDLAESHQPMVSPESGLAVAYNGEIYNYRALQDDLRAAGRPLQTSGDTEVLLRTVETDWEAGLDQLDGMFAFAAWDPREERLLLARDALGIKPLFFAQPSPGTLVFGSEIKALLAHPAVASDLDEDALRQVLRFRAVYGERSLYRAVRQVEPGSWIEFSRRGLRSGRHYDLARRVELCQREYEGTEPSDLVEQGRELFVQAVRKRLIADVPVGAFLSGGLDSSLVVATMRALRGPGAELRTYSVGFRDDPHSELSHARIVADCFGTQHEEVQLTESDYIEELSNATAARDAPLSEPADVAIARMSAVAKRTVKVVLSGEGADEGFCGYPKYRLAEAPAALRAGLRWVGSGRVSALAGRLGLDARRAAVVAGALAHRDEADRLVSWFSYLDRAALERVFPGLHWSDTAWEESRRPQLEALSRFPESGPTLRMQGLDCLTWLPGNLLERADRMTMASGLEARVPFLDKALVPFGLALPRRLKVRNGVGKWMLRQWAKELLPSSIIERRKWGFRVPLDRWFRGSLREYLRARLEDPQSLCRTYGDMAEVMRLVESHESGAVDANLALWTLLSTEIWYQDVFRSEPARSAGAR